MFQQLILIGRVGQEPEIKGLPSGSSVCNFSVATSEKWKDKNSGELQERTEWHRCAAFGRTAEIAGEYLHKGDLVTIIGKVQTQKYQDKEGNDRYSTSVKVDELKLMPNGKREGGGEREQSERPTQRDSRPRGTTSESPKSKVQDDFDDDIPF